MIDTHAHLQGLEGGADAAIEEAAAAGVERIVCVGDSPELAEEAIGLARAHAGRLRDGRAAPASRRAWDESVRARLDELLGDPSVVAVGECGLDYFRERASRTRRQSAFAGQVVLAEKHRKPLVIHTREAADDTLAVLRNARTAVILHCFSLPEHLDEVVERGWYVSFAGNVTYPSASDLADAARRVPAELLLLETDCPYLSPVPHRGKPNRPHYVLETLRAVAAMRGVDAGELASRWRRTPRASSPYGVADRMSAPRQVTLARLAELGLRPDRELGQHFLVDDNVLGVIERLADLHAGRRRARGRRRRRHAHRAARRAAARTCTRSRSTAASSRRSRARWTGTRT